MKNKSFIRNGNLIYSFGNIVLFILLVAGCSNQEINTFTSSLEEDTLSVHVISYLTPSPSKEGKQVYDIIAHFPEQGEWRKILMVQTIKCDQATK